jgi:exosome complex exonuclease RRP6
MNLCNDREQQGILACCNPIPPLVKQQLNELHLIILKARDMALTKSCETPTHDLNNSSLTNRVIDLDESLETRHDILHLDSDHNPQTLINDFSGLLFKN